MTSASIAALAVTGHPDRPEAETLIGLRSRGVDLRVHCAPAAEQLGRLVAAGVPVEPLEFHGKLDRAAIATIRAELVSRRVNVLHLFNNTAVLNGLVAARGIDVRIVAYRGIAGNVSFLSPLSWLRYLNPRVDRIVCVAEAVRSSFLRLGMPGLRVDPAKPVTIHKGHSPAWYTAPPIDRATIGLSAADFVVGCVANWRPRKGVEVLVRAFELLPPAAPIHLVLVGHMDDGALRRRVERSAQRERLHLLGRRSDAPAVIAACDVAVLPSIKREGLPKTVIEAMIQGIPPIVTDCGGSPELVVDGVSGLVVPVRDAQAIAAAITRLFEDASLRQRLGAQARERIVRDFRIEDTIERTLALYRALSAPATAARTADGLDR